jgi:hypothetical protein
MFGEDGNQRSLHFLYKNIADPERLFFGDSVSSDGRNLYPPVLVAGRNPNETSEFGLL